MIAIVLSEKQQCIMRFIVSQIGQGTTCCFSPASAYGGKGKVVFKGTSVFVLLMVDSCVNKITSEIRQGYILVKLSYRGCIITIGETGNDLIYLEAKFHFLKKLLYKNFLLEIFFRPLCKTKFRSEIRQRHIRREQILQGYITTTLQGRERTLHLVVFLHTLVVELDEPALVLRQLCTRWHLINLPLKQSYFTILASLRKTKTTAQKSTIVQNLVAGSHISQSVASFLGFVLPCSQHVRGNSHKVSHEFLYPHSMTTLLDLQYDTETFLCSRHSQAPLPPRFLLFGLHLAEYTWKQIIQNANKQMNKQTDKQKNKQGLGTGLMKSVSM